MKKIYVGNLPWATGDEELAELFSAHGEVISARVITDRETGRSRGFGFVEMEDFAAQDAISELNGRDFRSRPLRVSEAHGRGDSRGGDSRGGDSRGGGRPGGGGGYRRD